MQPHSVSEARGAADTPLSREGCRGDRPPTHCAGRHAPGLSATPTRFQGSFLGTGCRMCWHPHVKLKQHPHHLPACLSHIQPGEPAVAPAQDLGRVPPRGPGCLHEPLAQPHRGRGSLRPLLGSAGQPCTGGHREAACYCLCPCAPGGTRRGRQLRKASCWLPTGASHPRTTATQAQINPFVPGQLRPPGALPWHAPPRSSPWAQCGVVNWVPRGLRSWVFVNALRFCTLLGTC